MAASRYLTVLIVLAVLGFVGAFADGRASRTPHFGPTWRPAPPAAKTVSIPVLHPVPAIPRMGSSPSFASELKALNASDRKHYLQLKAQLQG